MKLEHFGQKVTELDLLHKGTYNGVSSPVSLLPFLQNTPSFGLQTDAPSPREATARARAPRPNRLLK